jgi:hypothetical protein
LANVYLHYVFDQWVRRWREKQAQGEMIVVRFADDIIVGFQHRSDAERFRAELSERFGKFALGLNPDKTRLIEFGRYASENRDRDGRGKPETFDFLGFTHACGKTRKGRFVVLRHTKRQKVRAKLLEIKKALRWRWHDPIPEVGRWLASVLRGHINYYAVPSNFEAVAAFRHEVVKLWRRGLCRRSQKGHVTWPRMLRIARAHLPRVRIVHPWPEQRLAL